MDLGLDRETVLAGVGVTALVLAIVVAGVLAGVVPVPVLSDYDQAAVVIHDENGTVLGRVQVRVADTFAKRYTGLSDTASLGPNEGMLFVYDDPANRTFVMRDMAFPLDIIFVGGDRQITAIAHAPVPPPGTDEQELTPYRGRAQWVLEVNYNWTVSHGVTAGDHVTIES